MAVREPIPPPVAAEDIKGTIWEGLAQLRGPAAAKRPFQVDSPGENENPQLYAGEKRVITYKGSGELLLFNIDLPIGVTLSMSLDGAVRKYSHGNEAGVLRWNAGESPFRFSSTLELIVTNTTGAGQMFKLHVSGV